MAEIMTRPKLTMPETEVAALHGLYQAARIILEYGPGGSTVMAAEMPGKRITSVESDAAWLSKLHGWFAQVPPASMPVLHHGNIGQTRLWGYPAAKESFRRWPDYVQSVWDLPDFAAPDVVLVDGRFRLACLLTVALRTVQPVVVLVDDYIDRPPYHDPESVLGAPQMIGRCPCGAVVLEIAHCTHCALVPANDRAKPGKQRVIAADHSTLFQRIVAVANG